MYVHVHACTCVLYVKCGRDFALCAIKLCINNHLLYMHAHMHSYCMFTCEQSWPSKIFNPPPQFSRLGIQVSCTCTCKCMYIITCTCISFMICHVFLSGLGFHNVVHVYMYIHTAAKDIYMYMYVHNYTGCNRPAYTCTCTCTCVLNLYTLCTFFIMPVGNCSVFGLCKYMYICTCICL